MTLFITIQGLAGGKWWDHSGSGSNYLCLPEVPEYDQYVEDVQQWRAYVYTAEYETYDFPPYIDKYQHDVPCAVCRITNRGSLMIPAKKTCPSGFIREYHGYLMSDYYNHISPMEFVCMDSNPDIVPGTGENKNGVLFYPTEGRCEGDSYLPCDPYINGAELTCVVCSI